MSTALPRGFDASEIEPTSGAVGQLPVSDPKGLPVVIYDGMITESKAGDPLIELHFRVIEGPYMGRTGRDWVNLYHPDPVPRQIAEAEMSAICHVTGKFQIGDLSELFNHPLRVVTELQDSDNENGYTTIKKYLDINGNAPKRTNQKVASKPSGPPTGVQQAAEPQVENQTGWGQAPAQQEQPAQAPGQAPAQAPAAGQPPWAQN